MPHAVPRKAEHGTGRASEYHVFALTQRSGRRDDADRAGFLAVFSRVCERFRWSCHSYCLMTNHYHAVVETAEANLSRGMRQLNGVCTERFNRAHQCVSHVYQGRYSAVLVQREVHFAAVMRYVMLNPVRAGMVVAADDWPWSSYRASIGTVAPPPWLRTDWIDGLVGSDDNRAAAFAQFVEDGVVEPSLWRHLTQQIYLGDAAFVSAAQKQVSHLPRVTEIPRIQRQAVYEQGGLMSEDNEGAAHCGDRQARNDAIVAAFATGRYTMREIGGHFGVHYSRVSRIVYAAETRDGARCKT